MRPGSALASQLADSTSEEFRAQHIALAAANGVGQNFNSGLYHSTLSPERVKEGDQPTGPSLASGYSDFPIDKTARQPNAPAQSAGQTEV